MRTLLLCSILALAGCKPESAPGPSWFQRNGYKSVACGEAVHNVKTCVADGRALLCVTTSNVDDTAVSCAPMAVAPALEEEETP